jgi:hypothetical protein
MSFVSDAADQTSVFSEFQYPYRNFIKTHPLCAAHGEAVTLQGFADDVTGVG